MFAYAGKYTIQLVLRGVDSGGSLLYTVCKKYTTFFVYDQMRGVEFCLSVNMYFIVFP